LHSAVDPSLSKEKLMKKPIKDLKALLDSGGIDHSGCVEKSELVDLIKAKLNL
jgi:hypothetical protein